MEFACLDFLNSDWHDYRGSGQHEDRLKQPVWLAQFTEHWRLKVAVPVDNSVILTLTALRALLHRLVESLASGHSLTVGDLNELNEFLKAGPSTLKLLPLADTASDTIAAYQLERVPLAKDWNWVLAELAADFARLLTEHEPARLKICGNSDCGWVFYDVSRNHSQRWCEDRTCGNLMKVRRFRARQRSAQTDSTDS